MKNLKKSFFICSLSLLPLLGYSQETKPLFKEGHKLFKLDHYRKALPYLEKVVEAEPNNPLAVFEAGVCYLHRYSKEKALEYIQKSFSLNPKVSKDIHYWLGRAYHQNYQYDKAIQEYNIYKETLSKSDQRRKDLEKHILHTNTARQLAQNPEDVKITNLGPAINTLYSEHSPVISKNDSLVLFTSRRHDVTGGKEDLDGEFFEDIFESHKLSNGNWSAPEKIQLNTSGHDGSIQIFDNDSKLLLYRQAKGGDIFITEKDPQTKTWKEPQKFADINTADFEADAYISADGKVAYFSTNHFKKTGDLDIYFITKSPDGTWSKPQELEGKINTPEDEEAPFLTPDGKTLYFSSRGHKNMGGFDVFKSTLDTIKGEWSTPVNLGYPINTPDDDVYYYMSSNGNRGYMSSYREGGYGEKDIYEIAYIAPVTIICNILPPCEGVQREPISYSITSVSKTTKPVALTGKVEKDKVEAKLLSYNSYRVAFYNSKDTLLVQNIDVPYTEEKNKVIENAFTIACPEPPIATTGTGTLAELSHKYIFRDIYFEPGKTQLTAEGVRELQVASEILKKNPNAEVKIKGFEDGNNNNALAAKRAKAVHDYLKANGVKNVLSDTVTKASNKEIAGRSVALDVKLKEALKKDFNPSIIAQASVGDTYILRNLFFETGKSILNNEAKEELNIMINILSEYPALQIEIAGNTDSRGPEDKNIVLSEQRAQAVADYLNSQGVSKERLSPKGYGESKPVADNNSDEGRKLNRRTEFKILKK